MHPAAVSPHLFPNAVCDNRMAQDSQPEEHGSGQAGDGGLPTWESGHLGRLRAGSLHSSRTCDTHRVAVPTDSRPGPLTLALSPGGRGNVYGRGNPCGCPAFAKAFYVRLSPRRCTLVMPDVIRHPVAGGRGTWIPAPVFTGVTFLHRARPWLDQGNDGRRHRSGMCSRMREDFRLDPAFPGPPENNRRATPQRARRPTLAPLRSGA